MHPAAVGPQPGHVGDRGHLDRGLRPIGEGVILEITNPIDLHGSLPLLGVRGHVVMAHGASDRRAIQAAIAQAVQAVRGQFVGMFQRALEETRARLGGPVTTP